MAQAAQKTCKSCAGRGLVTNAARQAQTCPNCSGSGVQAQKVYRVFYDYTFPTVALTASQSGVGAVLQIQFDSDFEWIWLVSTQTGAYSVQLQDGSTGRMLSNAPINNANFAGTAQLPFPLVEPYLLARSTSLNATFNDLSGSNNSVQLTLRGYKLFPQSAPEQGSASQVFQQTSSSGN